MKLKKIMIYCILSFFRPFLFFRKIDKNKITFVSLENSELVGDFAMISKELEKRKQYQLNYVLVKFEKTFAGNVNYLFACIKQLFEINTSGLVILDYNNYVVSRFKRKDVKVLQLWHASGAIKQFGNVVDRDYQIRNYDYVISNCDYFVKPFAKAFNVEENQVKVTGLPRTDRLFQKRRIAIDRKKIQNKFPQLENKKVILYAPTFRGRLMEGFKDGNINLDDISKKLGDDYIILYKMHPLLDDRMISNSDNVICCNGMSVRQLFAVTDILISDYSAIIIDYSVFLKPMIFYVPDLDEYRKEVGLFVDYEKEMPGPICMDEDSVIAAIKEDNFDLADVERFRDKFFKYQDGKSMKRVVQLVDTIMEDMK